MINPAPDLGQQPSQKPPLDRSPEPPPAVSPEPPRTRRNVLVGLGTLSALVLAFSYHTSLDVRSAGATATATAGAVPGTSAAAEGPAGVGTSSGASAAGAGGSAARAGGSASTTTGQATSGTQAGAVPGTLADGTYTGASAATRWGPVQVCIVVHGGRISAATAVTYPMENPRDQEINSQAVPAYEGATVTAQSAQIDAISGATVTWQGYTASLQSAIDQARA